MLAAEAALVTAGSTAGLVLQAAACITGDDLGRIARLPDVTGLRHEFVIQRAHRFSYDQAFRVPGGVLVEIGLGRRTMPYELEDAIGPRTAGVVHLVSPFTSPPGILPFEDVCRIAHARGVPVLVDAASMLPPRENLFRHLRVVRRVHDHRHAIMILCRAAQHRRPADVNVLNRVMKRNIRLRDRRLERI